VEIRIYLDGVYLPENVYAESDINFVISEVHRLTNMEEKISRYWENDSSSRVIFFYGESFEENDRIFKN
jgi:hypothetical protein